MIEKVNYQDPDLMYPEWDYASWLSVILLSIVIGLNILGSALSIVAENRKKIHEEKL